jgi:hypothetical protein
VHGSCESDICDSKVLIDEVTNMKSAICGRSSTFDLPGTSSFPTDCPMGGGTHSLTSAMSTLEWRVGCVARGVYAIGCADAVCALANPELAIDAHLPQRSRSHASQIGRSHLILLFVCFKRGFGYTRAYETESRTYRFQCLWSFCDIAIAAIPLSMACYSTNADRNV